jgi:hypothetical protein
VWNCDNIEQVVESRLPSHGQRKQSPAHLSALL